MSCGVSRLVTHRKAPDGLMLAPSGNENPLNVRGSLSKSRAVSWARSVSPAVAVIGAGQVILGGRLKFPTVIGTPHSTV